MSADERSAGTIVPMKHTAVKSLLRHIDPSAVSLRAQKESRNREIALPPISVYRWWARRTLAVNEVILDAFALDFPVGPQLVIDPFEGGGVIPLAAVAKGYRVYAQDLNPWAAAGLAVALRLPKPEVILAAVEKLELLVESLLRSAYATTTDNGEAATIAHTFRVSTSVCLKCSTRMRHFPYAMVTLLQRKERGNSRCLLACRAGHVFEGQSNQIASCPDCQLAVDPASSYTKGRDITCWNCDTVTSLSDQETIASWRWEVVLIERVRSDGSREIIPATSDDIQRAEANWSTATSLGQIVAGAETDVLLRHGFSDWSDLYPARQRCVTEALLTLIDDVEDADVRSTLRWAVLGTTEMAGLLSRWDRWYLKSYEAMAGHRFNFTTFAVEPNVWGTSSAGRGTFQRRIRMMCKAAKWLHSLPTVPNKVIGPDVKPRANRAFDVRIVCASSEKLDLPDNAAHLCLTDPPYHDDVQYGELSLPLRAWAGLSTAPLVGEAIVNTTTGVNVEEGDYGALLKRIFQEVNRTLRPDGHLVFSYANRSPDAWSDVIQSLNDAGFRCAGYAVIHSENETDHAKRNVRACTKDLILDMVPQSDLAIRRTSPKFVNATDEEAFLSIVGSYLLKVGALRKGWRETMIRELQSSSFLS